ncbi:hypothetical protein COT75_00675 [Candidatus Beckwithbacteria bacterium CG10_big_fil_rev_8_21_14_0_10_34_10]|uniref:Phospholipid/glycerol acyltransferase domain-containing protein n=1 Tax=Candidatus Beckwithbacteria bacterium CG10_big_fil_rev_8_21_14_0_10_34_10 TaxID=1974495 RepID=A0A2H0WAJ8_9BACT|nr:MAG: hypothetical protein COT75_00675 [Candidatus Beckwithbacteria bacterium CG10_big_fil_rev_8_21_14_0_10_34_10]
MSRESLSCPGSEPFMEKIRDLTASFFELTRFEVEGLNNLELMRDGEPVIIAFFPHSGHPDSLAVRRAFPQELRKKLIYPAAADYWHNGIKGKARSVLSSMAVNSFPVSRDDHLKGIESGLKSAIRYLEEGFSIVISPEGTRSSLPLSERNLRTGMAELILRTGRPVIPVRLRGLEDAMPKGSNFSFNSLVRDNKGQRLISVTFGKPIDFDLGGETLRSRQRKIIMAQLKQQFLQM